MDKKLVKESQTPWVRIVLAIYITLSIVMCFNKILINDDYEVFANEDGLPELDE